MLSIIGLVAYKFEDPLPRLFAVGFANICGALLKAVEWSDEKQAERHGLGRLSPSACQHSVIHKYTFLSVLALGLVISSLSKLVNHSNNVSVAAMLLHDIYSRVVISACLAYCEWSIGRLEQNGHHLSCPCRLGVRHP